MLRKKKAKHGTIELKQCKYKGINSDGRYIIECEVTLNDPRIPYKQTKATILIGEPLTNQKVEVVVKSED